MKPHILIVADGRSPTARSWIKNTQSAEFQVSLISTYPCDLPESLVHFQVIPVAFSQFTSRPGTQASGPPNRASGSGLKKFIRRFSPAFQNLRYHLGPLSLHYHVHTYRRLVGDWRPDLVHALRIPFEGMLASHTPPEIPMIVATWGNDLTLHALGSRLMQARTKRCLARANGLTSDTQRDVGLAQAWGLDPDAPTMVIPGSGGLDLDAIDRAEGFDPDAFGIPEETVWVINPRGLRPGSVNQDAFFASIPLVLEQQPNTVFICPAMAGLDQARAWVKQLGIEAQTFLLPKLPQHQLWALMKKSQVFVSPSSHDGTPNTLLEALACGCFPVVGDIESLREWIVDGVNGLLVDPRDPQALAAASVEALRSPRLRQKAASRNRKLVEEKAARSAAQPKINDFYSQFIG